MARLGRLLPWHLLKALTVAAGCMPDTPRGSLLYRLPMAVIGAPAVAYRLVVGSSAEVDHGELNFVCSYWVNTTSSYSPD